MPAGRRGLLEPVHAEAFSSPAARSAASTTLVSSSARVIGPTPPGIGASKPATSADLGRDVADRCRVGARDADVEHDRTRLDHVGGDQTGDAGGRDDDVGAADVLGEVTGAGVAQGHGGVLGAAGQQQTERATDGDAAADHADLGAVELDVVRAQELDDAARRAGQRRVGHVHEPAEVDRVQAVGVLGRVDELDGAVARRGDCGSGSWTMKPVQAGSSLRSVIRSSRNSWVMSAGWCVLDRGDSDLVAVAVLARDVRLAAGVVADQDGAESGRDAVLGEPGNAVLEVGLDGARPWPCRRESAQSRARLCHVLPVPRASPMPRRQLRGRSGSWARNS